MRDHLREGLSRVTSNLIQQLTRRDKLLLERDRHFDLITAILQAASPKRSVFYSCSSPSILTCHRAGEIHFASLDGMSDLIVARGTVWLAYQFWFVGLEGASHMGMSLFHFLVGHESDTSLRAKSSD